MINFMHPLAWTKGHPAPQIAGKTFVKGLAKLCHGIAASASGFFGQVACRNLKWHQVPLQVCAPVSSLQGHKQM